MSNLWSAHYTNKRLNNDLVHGISFSFACNIEKGDLPSPSVITEQTGHTKGKVTATGLDLLPATLMFGFSVLGSFL